MNRSRLAVISAVLAGLGLLAGVAARRRARRGGGGGFGPPPAGVREPRRPLQPSGTSSTAAVPEGS